jgi:flagellin-specific chaperone FliS
MASIAGYGKYQSISLEGEAAYEELYTRLARWTSEAIILQQDEKQTDAEAKLDRCIEILGYLDRGIDMSQNPDVATAILSLHRFSIASLVRAKSDQTITELEPLVKVFLSLTEIFAAIRESRSKTRPS